ncbi:MAG: two-component system chemotaxis response regulator CheY [Alphaproteobacteria bacterium]|jgi:two-component system chemotaxis response regulator CheY
MQLVIENAEEEIRERIEEVEIHPMAWRAIHCLWPDAPKYQLEELTAKLRTMLGDYDSYLFRWGVRDIFIISKGTRLEPLEKARAMVQSFSRECQNIPEEEPYETISYDLSIAWEEFRDFFSFREKEIAREVEGEVEEPQSIQRDMKEDEIKLIHMDFSDKKVELQRRAMRPGITVLAVDADNGTLELIDSICKGYKVLRAHNGEEALERYFDEAPDIVIMDTMLPIIDGWEVVKYIYEFDASAFVIMVTAKTDEKDVQRAITSGVKGIVKKPFNKAKIMQYLARFTANAPMHKRAQDEA